MCVILSIIFLVNSNDFIAAVNIYKTGCSCNVSCVELFEISTFCFCGEPQQKQNCSQQEMVCSDPFGLVYHTGMLLVCLWSSHTNTHTQSQSLTESVFHCSCFHGLFKHWRHFRTLVKSRPLKHFSTRLHWVR